MTNSKAPSTVRAMLYNGKNSSLPPKSPFPSISPSYTEHIPTSTISQKIPPNPVDFSQHHHHRTSSESFLMDEQPSWLEELLDEPDTPVKSRGHRRSSSDSFAYTDMSNVGFMNNPSHVMPLETDNKRAKQQFAQRSRVRKLQYIAELERNVQALQAEGSEVSAELEFVNQQNLILSMENKALKQRLENLAEEQLTKYLEHELLEREVGRLRSLYEHQQQPPQQLPQTGSVHRRPNSQDLDHQFSNLSLKPKESHDSVSGQLHM